MAWVNYAVGFFVYEFTELTKLVDGGGRALAAYGLSRRDSLGFGLSVIGLGLLTRRATNIEMKRLVGAGTALFSSNSKSQTDEEVQLKMTTETRNGPRDVAQKTLARGA